MSDTFTTHLGEDISFDGLSSDYADRELGKALDTAHGLLAAVLQENREDMPPLPQPWRDRVLYAQRSVTIARAAHAGSPYRPVRTRSRTHG